MRPAAAQQKALRFVESLMASAGAEARLPTVVELAGQAGVSPGAMWRVVNRLAREGVLVARPRSGIRLGTERALPDRGQPVAASVPAGQKWQRVRIAVESDLLRGKYPAGELLPPVKQLRGMYGACYATVRKALDSLVAGRLLAGALPGLAGTLAYEAEWQGIAQIQRPLMEQALACPGVTAWAAGNDRSALIALAFLKERGVRVPDDLSVVSFDDLPQAYAAGLTSYNFNESAGVRAVFSHVLGVGPRVRGVPAHEPVEIEGFMSVRATSGPAP